MSDESTEAFSTEALMASTQDNTNYLVFRILFAKTFIAHNLTKDPSFLLSFDCFHTFNVPEIAV